MSGWAIDLGTTNTGVARWDATRQQPQMLELPEVSRAPDADDPLQAPRLIPSATHVLEPRGFGSKLAQLPLLSGRVLWGTQAHIGRRALEMNEGDPKPAFAHMFKPYLAQAPLRTIARTEKRAVSARDVTRIFIRQLIAEVRTVTGERIRELTLTTPVDSFEAYRAEVSAAFRAAGVRKINFVDEPVAAAIGYGLSLRRERTVLVVDFGGGTLDLAVVRMTARDMQHGSCEVIAKEGRPIGGNHVDRWLLEEFCDRMSYPLSADAETLNERFWYRLMLNEACRVKEEVFFKPQSTFVLTPPEELRSFEARLRGDDTTLDVNRDDIVEILTRRGMYDALRDCSDGLLDQMMRQGMNRDDIEDVLMVGGSTLLPGVYGFFEDVFGRGRVRAFQPFEAVTFGACAFAAGNISTSDFIVHDYAFVTHNLENHEPEYTTIIPRGTRFPTRPDLWKQRLIPTCSMGEPERIFKLVIAEVGNNKSKDRMFGWDAEGNLHAMGGTAAAGGAGATSNEPLVVRLNDSNPALGTLDPPHMPGDRTPRLEIAFGVNADRWLIATVTDLKTNKVLMREEAVVQLL